MKSIDFTQPGGFPLTQDILGWLQDGWAKSFEGLGLAGQPGTTPVILSGMVQGPPVGGGMDGNISSGYFFYGGQVIEFIGGDYGVASFGHVLLIHISDNGATLAYNDGSNPTVKFNRTAATALGPSVTDADNFPYSDMLTFGVGLALNNRENTWTTIAAAYSGASNADIAGDIYYKKNSMSNTLEVRAELNVTNVGNATGPTYALLGTLPVGYRVATLQYVIGCNSDANMKAFGDSFRINAINFAFYDDGSILVSCPRSSGDSDYSVFLSCTLSLE